MNLLSRGLQLSVLFKYIRENLASRDEPSKDRQWMVEQLSETHRIEIGVRGQMEDRYMAICTRRSSKPMQKSFHHYSGVELMCTCPKLKMNRC